MTVPSTPGMSWGPVASLGGQLTGNPAVAPSSDGRLEVFARGRADNALSACHQQTWGGWSPWENLGAATLAGGPSALRTAARRIGVFFRNGQGNLEHPWQTVINGTYGPGKVLANSIGGDPVPGLNADGRPEAFFRGTDNALWHLPQTDDYNAWATLRSLGGTLTGNPAVARAADARLAVFHWGGGHLWVNEQTIVNGTDWSAWEQIAQNIGGEPVVEADGHGRLNVFFHGSDHAVWHIAQMFGQPAAGYATSP